MSAQKVLRERIVKGLHVLELLQPGGSADFALVHSD
jgi:hypothetical protein